MHEGRNSPQAIGRDTAFSGLLARLERDGMNEQIVSAWHGAEQRPHATGDRRDTNVGEPLTPELVLVDPDLARRAREQLPEREPERRRVAVEQKPAAQPPLFGFVQPTPSAHAVDLQLRRRKRRRRNRVLVLLILGIATAAAILRVEPLRHFFWESREATVVPSRGTTKPNRRPANPPAAQSARAFAWVSVPNATYYLVQFYRGRDEIFRARPSAPRLLVPAQWAFKGRRYSLTPGRYRWSVRPGFGRPSQARYGQPVVRAKLVIQRSSGG